MLMIADPFMVPITLFVVVGASIVLAPIARAYARRMDRSSAPPSLGGSDVQDRLARMEQAIEAIAVEGERHSEGQRFTTRLLSERADDPQRAMAPSARREG